MSQAKERSRSYGSMSYAGLKSMIFAGVKADDPRVKAVVAWLQKNYSVKENPGMGAAGLFYYYHLMSKSLDALGQPTFEDAKHTKHDWRNELATELLGRQQADGSWANENKQWMEGDPNLTTSFACSRWHTARRIRRRRSRADRLSTVRCRTAGLVRTDLRLVNLAIRRVSDGVADLHLAVVSDRCDAKFSPSVSCGAAGRWQSPIRN